MRYIVTFIEEHIIEADSEEEAQSVGEEARHGFTPPYMQSVSVEQYD